MAEVPCRDAYCQVPALRKLAKATGIEIAPLCGTCNGTGWVKALTPAQERHKTRKKKNRERNKKRLAKKKQEQAGRDAEVWKNRRTRR